MLAARARSLRTTDLERGEFEPRKGIPTRVDVGRRFRPLATRPLAMRFPVLVLAALLASPAAAQTLDAALPASGGPGDLVILRGSGLSGVTAVHFTGSVGGFVGPQAVPPSSPFGFLTLNGPWQPGPQLDFFFFEEPTQDVAKLGQGSTQTAGIGRAVTTFDIGKGGPKVVNSAAAAPLTVFMNNPNFVARLLSLDPGAPQLAAASGLLMTL